MTRTDAIQIEQWQQIGSEGAAPAVRIRLHGNSMRPLVRKDRDIVTIAPLYRVPKVGDIVLFRRADGQYVVHRVRSIRADSVQTLGDGCLAPDAPMRREAICGIVIAVERDGKRYGLNTAFARGAGRVWMWTLPLRRLAVPVWRKIRRCLHD